MKPSDKAAIFIIPAGILMFVGVFARSLGLSETTGLVLFLTALVLFLSGYREMIKAREIAGKKSPTSNPKRQILPGGALQPQGAGGGDTNSSPDK